MLDISVTEFMNAKVHIITIDNRRLLWVEMHEVYEGLGIKNISDLVRKEIHCIFEIKNPSKDQIRRYKRPEKEWFSDDIYAYVRSDLILKLIKNCRR